jgi:glycerol-3-phosphate acyltransferase PlsY
LFVLPVIIGYLLGSISFSYLFGRMLKGIDIRQHGSGNAGATNTLRILGTGPAIAVLLLDALKGVAAVEIGRWMAPDMVVVAVLSGLFAIIGHNWPVYFGFRGGKGIATTIGAMATLAFLPALFAGIAAILLIAVTRFVSLGSLGFALLLPIFVFVLNGPDALTIGLAAVIVCLFAFVRHRTNIIKLLQGRENKLGARHKSS